MYKSTSNIDTSEHMFSIPFFVYFTGCQSGKRRREDVCEGEFRRRRRENVTSRVKTRRGVSGPKMDLLCGPDV